MSPEPNGLPLLPAYDPAAPLAGHAYRLFSGDRVVVVSVADDAVTCRPGGGSAHDKTTVTLAAWRACRPVRTS